MNIYTLMNRPAGLTGVCTSFQPRASDVCVAIKMMKAIVKQCSAALPSFDKAMHPQQSGGYVVSFPVLLKIPNQPLSLATLELDKPRVTFVY